MSKQISVAFYNRRVNAPTETSAVPPPPATAPAAPAPWHGVDHYENFPVASWLLPRRLRPAVVAIYRFARHADDIADEGDADVETRDRALLALQRDLAAAEAGGPAAEPVVAALVRHVTAHRLAWRHFHDLLDAFRQDLRVRRYADAAAVDDYCRRSANPVGRLMLELFDAADPHNLAASDAICSGLQRANFLQDIVVDLAKDRIYLPLATLAACGIDEARLAADIRHGRFSAGTRRAVAIEAHRTREQLLLGRPLLASVPARLGLELRFVLAGALRILDRLQALDHDVAAGRPTLGWRDGPALLLKAARLPRLQAVGP
jgi:squalene synthase HpnC